MDFRSFYLALTPEQRDAFAAKAGTTRGYCNQVAYAAKQIELGMADVFVKLSEGAVSLEELPLTERARWQRLVREGAVTPPPVAA